MIPEGLSVNPAGSAPLLVQVLPPDPPIAESDCEYGTETMPLGRTDVATVSGRGSTVIWSGCVSLSFSLSTTRTLKLKLPAALGVPAIVPELLSSARPPGKPPDAIDQVKGCFPPLVSTPWL